MNENFIPAAHYHFLTPVYEWLARPFIGRTWDAIAKETSKLAPKGSSIIDIGCGPGTVLRHIRQKRPDLRLRGFDIDPAIVNIAKQKTQGLEIDFAEASIDSIPLADQSVDLVINNMVFHHLPTQTKLATFSEVKRVLKPNGSFLLCDFSMLKEDRISFSLLAFFSKLIEPEVIPQLEGQLFEMAKESHATVKTLRTFYGCIALHHFQFPH